MQPSRFVPHLPLSFDPLQIKVQRSISTADHLHPVGNPSVRYPLSPLIWNGCENLSNEQVQIPLEVAYRYQDVPIRIWRQPSLPGLARWQPLLPPLAQGLSMGEGGTPLVTLPVVSGTAHSSSSMRLFIKDESRNPTWSHKDRLNLCTVSAAVNAKAPGIVVASSGNHGASAAAYAARGELPCIILLSKDAPESIKCFLQQYGATVLSVATADRWPIMRMINEQLGYHPVSNLTATHTGHPFASEGYKTIAYELYAQLGHAPSFVFVPTGYGELIYGVAKGFQELKAHHLIETVPRLVSCEPAARAPLALAMERGEKIGRVSSEQRTIAASIATTVSGIRGYQALVDTNGIALRVNDDEMKRAARVMAIRGGMWSEPSAAAGVAGFAQLRDRGFIFDGDVVCISTSSGFKYPVTPRREIPEVSATWSSVKRAIRQGRQF